MRGKLIEDLKHQSVVLPAERSDNSTLYNGAVAGAATGIDTQNYDEINLIIHAGTFTGDESMTATVLECATDDDTAATAISGAAFSAITTANDNAIHNASIRCADYKRYLYVKTVQTGTGSSVFGVTAVLGKGKSDPQSNSAVFDV